MKCDTLLYYKREKILQMSDSFVKSSYMGNEIFNLPYIKMTHF